MRVTCKSCGKSSNLMTLDGKRRTSCPLCDAELERDYAETVRDIDTTSRTREAFTSGRSDDSPDGSVTAEQPTKPTTQGQLFVAPISESVFGLWRSETWLVVNAGHNRFPNRCLLSNVEVPQKEMRQYRFDSTLARSRFGSDQRRSFSSYVGLRKEALPFLCFVPRLGSIAMFVGFVTFMAVSRAVYIDVSRAGSWMAILILISLLVMLFGFVASLVGVFFNFQPLKVTRRKQLDGVDYFWVKGVHPEILRDLPEWDRT